MNFDELLAQVIELLRIQRRVSYRALKRRFGLDEECIEDLKAEIIEAKRLAADEEGKVLVWTGSIPPAKGGAPEAERRHITVMFCDLAGSTGLSERLDPEELREVVRAYQTSCLEVIDRYEGHVAQYLGDGLLAYFGYPLAHEDDARRAVRTGLEIVGAMAQLNLRIEKERGIRLAIRLGIHTGLVVVGEMGRGAQSEQLAVGETPNLAARLQGLAEPNTMVISGTTYRLIEGFFDCDSLAVSRVRGFSQPIEVYRVLRESFVRDRLEASRSRGLTPLAGREQETRQLVELWGRAKGGAGQVVLIGAEAGMGKSRLVQALKEHAGRDSSAWFARCQCSPYHQNTAFHPVIEFLERGAIGFENDDPSDQRLRKIEEWLLRHELAVSEAAPLIASLLSVPAGDRYPVLNLTAERQKQKTMQTLVQVLLQRAARQEVLFVVEDLHWADPSTLDLLTLLIEQAPEARILALFTFRPECSPAWAGSSVTRIQLERLGPGPVGEMINRLASGKSLPPEVIRQITAKTDGVPLFVEEVTKAVIESGLLREQEQVYELTGPLPSLAIPATLHDSLMARLDRLASVKIVVQLGAVLGREFSYELIRLVSPVEETTLRHELARLVEAELLYQRGEPPRSTYLFKHALIQEEAYHSMLKRTRQQYHRQIAQALDARFPEIAGKQPELVAYHYTEGGLGGLAIGYWQRAGQRAMERSAHLEAIHHFSKGLELVKALPDTAERAEQELMLQVALGIPMTATGGFATPEVEKVYARAWELCQQVEESPKLFPVLMGLLRFFLIRGEVQTARGLGERLYALARTAHAPELLLEAHRALGGTLFWLGELPAALRHLEQAISRYHPQRQRSHAVLYGIDPMVFSLSYAALSLWVLGYPDQALQRNMAAMALAYELPHPYSLGFALNLAAILHHFRRESNLAQERAEAGIALSIEQAFPAWRKYGTLVRGWALAERGHHQESLEEVRQCLDAQHTAVSLIEAYYLALLGEVHCKVGREEQALSLLAQALDTVRKTGARFWEPEVYRLQGEILSVLTPRNHRAAEHCFHQALHSAHRQSATSLELRAVMSLNRLWKKQGKCADGGKLLADIYGKFSEGFDTADLREARAILDGIALPESGSKWGGASAAPRKSGQSAASRMDPETKS